VGTKEQDEYACQAYLDYCASDQVGGDDDAEDGSHGSDTEDDSGAEDKDDEQSGGENTGSFSWQTTSSTVSSVRSQWSSGVSVSLVQ
jgi:hypothetical protein